MTIGIGGLSQEQAMARLQNRCADISALPLAEYEQRLKAAAALMKAQNIAAMYLHAGTSLRYFTGLNWYASERMVGALLTADGALRFIAPHFELGTLQEYMLVQAPVSGWHEHECPYELLFETLLAMGVTVDDPQARLAIDESTPFFVVDGLQQCGRSIGFINAKSVTATCRMRKSAAELALMTRAKEMTLEVHQAAASILQEGISTLEVEAFIDEAHRKVGAPSGSYFCIVLFGAATAFPHGVKEPQYLKQGDMVLIDTGCELHGYLSDITRSYVFGEASAQQRRVWQAEKSAQAAAFAAARLGQPCGAVDLAARKQLMADGFGPDYALPGLPHRTGHGIGLDIHEWPYLVSSDQTPLDVGMCFSNEPMICVPGEFGIRLEDHFYMTEDGPKWFTEPSYSIDDPFGLQR